MTDVRINEAVDGPASFFADRQTRAGVVARQLLGITHRDDDRLVEHLIRERRSKTRFAVSCFALRSVLYAREERRDAVRRHIESLLTLLIALRALRTQAVTRSAPQPFKKLHPTAARERQR